MRRWFVVAGLPQAIRKKVETRSRGEKTEGAKKKVETRRGREKKR